MHSKLNDQIRKVLFRFMLGGIALFLSLGASGSPVVHAKEAGAYEPSAYYTITPVTLSNGTIIEKHDINGPPAPPPGFEVERQAVSLPEPYSVASISTLTVPAFNWVFGCSAVSGAMIAGYYDRMGWSNIYTGPTNGGVMPLDNSSWPTWSDGFRTYPNCPLIASKNGVDGRITRGSIDDYWVKYSSSAVDPYITNGWTQHTWGDAIGDYMYTSQSTFGNSDGSTSFYNWSSSSAPLPCDFMASNVLYDGTLGRKLFYEARGYTVTDCYNQKTDNTIAGGFSFTQFKAEIDAGRPVMLNLAGHTVVGVGYDDSSSLVYIHDTWDYNNHTMTWGGSYSGMALQSVSIVNIQGTVIPADKIGVFRNGAWFLDNNGNDAWDGCGTDGCWSLGMNGDIPIVVPNGGTSAIGVFRNGAWFLDSGNNTWDGCGGDYCYSFGMAGDTPVVGKWAGVSESVGVFRSGTWFLDYNTSTTWDGCGTDSCVSFGMAGDIPVVGDWNGSGTSKVGVFRSGGWFLDYNGNNGWDGCGTDSCVSFGMAGDIPVVGDWNGSGTSKIGVYRNGTWFLDYNGNGVWDGCGTDSCVSFGVSGDKPVVGIW